ncbi:hypothetical protein BC831DRAFT_515863 [Entophlyctis helioformis]|nr:hypothetical protein BC831DRAFT_515863 [Entophlyctis helioformis]
MPDDDLTPVEGLVRGTVIAINSLAVLANLSVMTAIFSTPKLLTINEIAFNMSLTVSDFCFSLLLFLLISTGFGTRASFLDNRVICQLVGISLQIFAVGSMLTLLAISFHNFCIIYFEGHHWSRQRIAGFIGGIWVVTVMWACLPLAVPGGGYVKQPSTFHCALDAVSLHPAAVTVRLLNIAVLSMTPTLIGVFYCLIIRKLYLTNKNLMLATRPYATYTETVSIAGRTDASPGAPNPTVESQPTSRSESESDHPSTPSNLSWRASYRRQSSTQHTILVLQIALVKRAMALVAAFTGSWGAYLILVIVSTVRGQAGSPLTEAWVFIFLSFNALLNPVLQVVMDRRYKESAAALMGFRKGGSNGVGDVGGSITSRRSGAAPEPTV